MFERYTERARRALFFARYEVTRLGGSAIETEHLLLGLLREARGVTADLFARARVSEAEVRAGIERRASGENNLPTSAEVPFSVESKRVLQLAAAEADRLLHRDIGTEHLLLGILRVDGSVAASVLVDHGLGLEDARGQVAKAMPDDVIFGEAGDAASPEGEGGRMPIDAVLSLVDRIGRVVADLSRPLSASREARELAQGIQRELDEITRTLRE